MLYLNIIHKTPQKTHFHFSLKFCECAYSNILAINTPNYRNMRLFSNLHRRVRRPVRRLAVGSTMSSNNGTASSTATSTPNTQATPAAATTSAGSSSVNARSNPAAVTSGTSRTASPHVNLQDLMRLRGDLSSAFQHSRIVHEFVAFVRQELFNGRPVVTENYANAIKRAISWLGQLLTFLPQYEIDQYDSRESIFRLVRHTLTRIFDWIQYPSMWTEARLTRFIMIFIQRSLTILYKVLGIDNTEIFWPQFVRIIKPMIRDSGKHKHFLKINFALLFLFYYSIIY